MTREDILEAAAQVFRQKGFHGASMANIADAVNLQKASLYHHVSSKQEILLELLDRALELLLERISPIAGQSVPADERLRQMIREYLQILAENTDLSAVLLFEHRSLESKQHARHVPTGINSKRCGETFLPMACAPGDSSAKIFRSPHAQCLAS